MHAPSSLHCRQTLSCVCRSVGIAVHFIDAGVKMRSVLKPRSSPHAKTSAHNHSSWITSFSNKIPSALVCSVHKEDGQISLI